MSQPVGYSPATNFQQEETNAVAGRSTVRTAMVVAELNALALTISQTLANLAVIQRDDTALRDQIVTTESLSANVKALFAGGVNPRGAWLTATAYAVKDVVETGTPLVSYICVTAHTSGTFATDRTAGKWMVLGQEPGTGTFTNLVLTTGGIALGTNNTQDLAATANRFRSGYFGTSVFASTSVVTPLVGTDAAVALSIKTGGTVKWNFNQGGAPDGTFYPNSDGLLDIGTAVARVKTVFSTIIDSGTTGSLSFKTNNGTGQVIIEHVASAVNVVALTGGPTGSPVSLYALGSDLNIGVNFLAKGVDGHAFYTNFPVATAKQFEVIHTASATRNITVTGSNGGNPTISTRAGDLAITPNVVMAGTLTTDTILSAGTTATVFNTVATTVNAFGAAT